MKKRAFLLLFLSGATFADLIGDCQNSTIFPDCGKEPPAKQPSRYDELLDQAISENEPNDTDSQANPLDPGTPIKGRIGAEGDLDLFLFQTDQDGVSAEIEIPGQRSKWTLSILDGAGQEICRYTSDREDRRYLCTLSQKGSYTAVVSGERSDREYVFLISGNGLSRPVGSARYLELLAQAISEDEPNDSRREADKLKPGTPLRGSVRSGEKDWFAFAVQEGGSSATLEIPTPPGSIQVQLLAADGSEVRTFEQRRGDPDSTFHIQLPTGKYFLKVTGEARNYVFLLQGDGVVVAQNRFAEMIRNALWEIEPNDTSSLAKPLPVGTFVNGDFDKEIDRDLFAFLPSSETGSQMSLEISETPFPVEIAILNSELSVIALFRHEGFDSRTFKLQLPRRDNPNRPFFLQLRPLSPPSGSTPHYAFLASGDIVPFSPRRYDVLLSQARLEEEPNDSFVSADGLTPGVPVRGQLARREVPDVDLFAIEAVRDSAVLHLEMPTPDLDSDGEADSRWRIQILDEGGNVIAERQSLASGVLLFSTSLPRKGRYFIQISALEEGTTDVEYVFNVTGEGLAAASKRDASPSFNDVEIEPNDTLQTATPLSSGVNMKGHLTLGGDKIDLYRLESKGNEILRFELCPDFHPCSKQNAWVLYLFNDRITQRLLDTEINFLSCGGVVPVNHPYLLADRGFFAGSLIGTIDPTFPNATPPTGRVLEVAVRDPGVYYVGISSPLERDENGSVIQTDTCPDGQSQFWFIREIFSDDQYLFRVFATRLDPVSGDDAEKQTLALVNHNQLYLPKVAYGGLLYEVYLDLEAPDGELFAKLRHVRLLGTATGGEGAATFDGRYLLVPEGVYRGRRYRADFELIDSERWLLKLLSAEEIEKGGS